MNYNRVVLGGRLTRDPASKNLASGTTLVEFGLAVNRKYKSGDGSQKEDVLFVDCTAFGRSADLVAQYCRKGSELLLDGRLRQEFWEDKKDGAKRSKISLVVENFQFLGGKNDGAKSEAKESKPVEEEQGGFDRESIPF